MFIHVRVLLIFCGFSFCFFTASAQHGTTSGGANTRVADSIRAGVDATLADGLELSLWASEDLVADPISLFMDDNGRAFYTRTNRQYNAEFDIRDHRDWMIPSISFKTVEDRRAFLREELSPDRSDLNTWRLDDLNGDGSHDWLDLTIEKEHIYRIEDTSGDGLADQALLVVDDFNEEHTDVAGTVLYHEGDLFVGVGPDMWRMQDTDGDGVMDQKTSISHGYAVHIGFGAHGMSGLRVGPDGKIYWGIGDIGFYGTDQTGTLWDYSNQGVIVRSNPDGSDFEVYAAGLRNTHEFVFDAYGNIISEDNDGDHPGEKERLVYIVNGSDAGWRTNWQFGKYVDPKNNDYKVWMDESYFRPQFEGQAAHLVPPLMLYHNGPAGMAFNPGTALGEEWKDHFFVAEFVGTPTRSKVHAFTLKPKGAAYELDNERVAVGGVLTSGMSFGPDGALYLADWIDGWGTKGQGRIWKLDIGGEKDPIRAEVEQLLATSFDGVSDKNLYMHLHHDDMRVRQKAQFALVERGRKGRRLLRNAARKGGHQFARIHGLWGLAQIAREQPKQGKEFMRYLKDEDPEIRAQAVKMIGDIRYPGAGPELVALLEDEHDRVRFFAAEAIGRTAYAPAVPALLALLEENNDQDVYLRHAGSLALARIGDADALVAQENNPSRAVRIAAVVALRRLQHPGVAVFLDDEDEHIVTDAARAINDDASIEDALPELAALLETTPYTNEPLLRRSINANSRVGGVTEANRLAAFAVRKDVSTDLSVEALAALAVWHEPSTLDRVDGTLRGPAKRDPEIARRAVAMVSDQLVADSRARVRVAFIEAAVGGAMKGHAAAIDNLLRTDTNAEVREAAIRALDALDAPGLADAFAIALTDRVSNVRQAALDLAPGARYCRRRKSSVALGHYS